MTLPRAGGVPGRSPRQERSPYDLWALKRYPVEVRGTILPVTDLRSRPAHMRVAVTATPATPPRHATPARPLPHHRTCGPASGGSSSRRIETLPGLAQGQQAEAVPVGIGQGHLKDLRTSNPPVSLAATRPFAGVALGDTAYPQVVPLGSGGLPFLPAHLPQTAAQPSVQIAERRSGVREPEVGHPAGGEPVEPADAVIHRHAPAPPRQDPQLILQPLDRLRGDPDPDLQAGEKEPEPQQRRLGGVPDRGLLPVHLQLQPPFDHAADALEHPLSSPFAAHEDPQVIGLCGLPDYADDAPGCWLCRGDCAGVVAIILGPSR